MMICCDACQNTIMLTLKEDNTSHEASRCELTTHIITHHTMMESRSFYGLLVLLNSLLLFVHIFTNSAVFQLPEGKMLSYFGFVSILLPSYFCVYIITIHVKLLSNFLYLYTINLFTGNKRKCVGYPEWNLGHALLYLRLTPM